MNEAARILSSKEYPGGWQWLRIATDGRGVLPGQFLRLNGGSWSVMRAADDWVECLQQGIARPAIETELFLQRPLGPGFRIDQVGPRALLLGSVEGFASLVFLADVLRGLRPRVKSLLLFELSGSLPFQRQPSRIIVPGLPAWVIAAIPLLEDWGVPSRLAASLPGCFEGEWASWPAAGWIACKGPPM